MSQGDEVYQDILELSKKRGIFWNSYEIYGGLAGFYDMGPVGVLIKRALIDKWLRYFVYSNDMVVEIETPLINPRIVFVASGHEESFLDPVVYCLQCKRVFRADHLIKDAIKAEVEGAPLSELEKIIRENNIRCPECGGELSAPFNVLLLFKTEIGPYKGEVGYLKPEHAQGMFVNFANVLRVTRNRLPLGIAQVGKVARNEISPRQGLLRLREFTIMELEFFFDPQAAAEESAPYLGPYMDMKLNVLTAPMRSEGVEEPAALTVGELVEKGVVKTPWLAYWMAIGTLFLNSLGIPSDRIRFVEKLPHERAHYSAQTFDQEVYTSKYGWVEVAGYAYRTDYDLSRHIEHSGADLYYFKRYETPILREVRRAYPNYDAIRGLAGDRFQEIARELQKYSPEALYEVLERRGEVEVGGIKLGREYFIVKSAVEKISGERIIPHVVEPSFGVERLLYVVLEHAYTRKGDRVVLKLPKDVAPYQVAVFPLLAGKKEEHVKMVEMARDIYRELLKRGIRAIYDDDGSIGRRYARADEIGVPLAITVDHKSLEDGSVTVRFRDTWEQVRVSRGELVNFIKKYYEEQLDTPIVA